MRTVFIFSVEALLCKIINLLKVYEFLGLGLVEGLGLDLGLVLVLVFGLGLG